MNIVHIKDFKWSVFKHQMYAVYFHSTKSWGFLDAKGMCILDPTSVPSPICFSWYLQIEKNDFLHPYIKNVMLF